MLKQNIRKLYLQKRLSLSLNELQDMSVIMTDQFHKMTLPDIRYVLSYSPLTSKNEFDISACEAIVKVNSPHVKIALPKTSSGQPYMEARVVNAKNLLIKNKYNILEPVDGDLVDAAMLDLVFVPLLAFDEQGYRVGYGKGFYDYFFTHCRPDVIKLGFSFFDPIPEIADINEFDVPLNFCITPMRTYEFQ